MRRKTSRRIQFAVISILFATITTLSHHGSAGYDSQNPVTMTGVITRVELVNPHSFVYIDVKDSKGHIDNWALEGSAPNGLSRSGLSKDNLKIGSEITVIGFTPRASYPSGPDLNKALAYSPGAIDHLKASHILQVGEIRIDGEVRGFGMGPKFTSTR